jgi:hypothetical protein
MHENELAPRISLDGMWQGATDDESGALRVPGVWERQGLPHSATTVTYTRSVIIPAEWQGARVMLACGAVSYYVEVRLNGAEIGTHEGMWTSFDLDLTPAVRFGQANELEMRITKPGMDGDAFPYHEVLVGFIPYIAITFGGPWQSMALVAHAAPAWSEIHVMPDSNTGAIRVSAQLSAAHDGLKAAVTITNADGVVAASAAHELAAGESAVVFNLDISSHRLWSPADPYLYQMQLTLQQDDAIITCATRRFGFRRLQASGEKLLLNGAPAHLRGLLSWGWNPAELAPTFSDAEIRDEFRRIRQHGFNLLKLCLFVPAPRLYEIADEEGILLWLELPMWLPRLSDHLRQQARAEYRDILARDHHHPSIVLYSLGCELGAGMADAALLSDLDTIVRSAVTGVLVCDNSGSGEAYRGLTFDFADFNDYHFYCDLHYFNPLLDHFQRDWRPPRPWIFGEFSDKDDYRSPASLLEDGARPWWRDLYGIEGSPAHWAYPEQEQRMAALGLPFSDEQISHIARRESLVMRKYILEQTRLRRSGGGYVVTGLRDTPITTSGIFDDHNRPKHDPAAFRAFNADAVLLLERRRARTWQHGGDRPAPVDAFNYPMGAPVELHIILAHTGLAQPQAQLIWGLYAPDSAEPVIAGHESLTLAEDSPGRIATIRFDAPALTGAQQYLLRVALAGIGENQWPLWFYALDSDPYAGLSLYNPAEGAASFAPPEAGILLATMFTSEMSAWVAEGGRALLLASDGGGLPVIGVPFWRESTKLLYPHPVLADFPHQGYSDMQFYHLATDHAFDTPRLAAAIPGLTQTAIHPIIRRLDARLFTVADYLVELHIGKGRLIASTLRFEGGAGDQVNGLMANVAGRWLLRALVSHLQR